MIKSREYINKICAWSYRKEYKLCNKTTKALLCLENVGVGDYTAATQHNEGEGQVGTGNR